MRLDQEPGQEMRALMGAVRQIVDLTVRSSAASLRNGASDEAPESEKKAYRTLRDALRTDEQLDAFEGVVKNACLNVLHSFFTAVDEGASSPEGSVTLDLVDKETGESVVTWSAQEEFWYTMPDDFVPFDYD